MILRAVRRQEIVTNVASKSIEAIITTPARETVRTMARQAAPTVAPLNSLSQTGMRELIAATNSGAVVQRKTERLFESSRVPGTRSI